MSYSFEVVSLGESDTEGKTDGEELGNESGKSLLDEPAPATSNSHWWYNGSAAECGPPHFMHVCAPFEQEPPG